MKSTIKFTIKQDGTVLEEVIGAEGNTCVNITKPFEEALGLVNSRELKTDYYVSLQQTKNKATEEVTVTSDVNADGLSS
tara:strand:- start:520 stop:756 length:237 start_codon:yes stop_codon:yes gene_type:complete